MTPEEKSLLERTHALAEENNSILRSMRRTNRASMIFRVVYWVVIIAIGLGAYYFVEPYIRLMVGLFGQAQNGVSSLNQNLNTIQGAADNLRDLLK